MRTSAIAIIKKISSALCLLVTLPHFLLILSGLVLNPVTVYSTMSDSLFTAYSAEIPASDQFDFCVVKPLHQPCSVDEMEKYWIEAIQDYN